NPGALRVFAHLTPIRNREIVLLADRIAPLRRRPDDHETLATTIYDLLRGLIDDQGVRAFNMAIALPPLTSTAEDCSEVPIIARLMDRGDPLATSSDWGAIELLGTGCIVSDPFEVARRLRVQG